MLQPDTNLGSGEAYVRQYLYGQQYFRSRFGAVPEIAYQVDSFGHAAGLPSIYRGVGCRFAVQCRPSQQQFPTPSRIFRWRGPDGTEVLTANLEGYGLELEAKDPTYTFAARLQRAPSQAPEGLGAWVVLVGFGDHGGGQHGIGKRNRADQTKRQLDAPVRHVARAAAVVFQLVPILARHGNRRHGQ